MVHYRVGSLEIIANQNIGRLNVHYRVGSLEKRMYIRSYLTTVHYRVGSLEIPPNAFSL